jgi:hypothetical protein
LPVACASIRIPVDEEALANRTMRPGIISTIPPALNGILSGVRISLLHFDVDLYKPTLVALRAL